MRSHLDKISTLDPNTSEAVDNIIARAIRSIETSEDKPGVVEVARRKFLILFKDGSDRYNEAHARLLHVAEPHLLAQTMQEADELGGAVDEDVASSLGPDLLAKMSGVFSVLLGKAKTRKELELAFNKCEGYINRFVTPERTCFPLLKKIELRIRLILSYDARETELEG